MNDQIVVFNGPRAEFTVREYPVADPGPDEILVKVTQACVCGSDLHMWRGETPPFDRLVAGRFPLDQVNQAFREADWATKAGQVPRAIITC